MMKIISILATIWAFQVNAANLPLTIQTAQQESKERLVLAAQSGRSLYTFTPDELNKSNCKGGCASTWPPVLISTEEAPLLTGVLGTTTREDGSKQLTVSGQPVYFFAGDQAAGEINGEGLNGVWFVLDLNLVRKK